MSIHRSANCTIDLAALQHNFQRVKQLAPDSRIMPVIKANAYGHGMLNVARALTDADGFAVAQLVEAIELRSAGIDQPITVFQGFQDAQGLSQVFEYDLRPAISQLWQIDLLEQIQADQSIDIWLKVNTGMGRLGVMPDEVDTAWERLNSLDCVQQLGLMTHFANADDVHHVSNQQQVDYFRELAERYDAQTSISNSAGIISSLYPQQDWVRPGIMLYGASPLLDKTAQQLGLKPVMTLQAELIAINQCSRGQHVGYGYQWECPEDMPVGIVNIGYADGYPRHAENGTPVMVNQQLTRLIGRVSMDSIAVDLRGIQASCGDSVELWGQHLPIDDVAKKSTTISYELLCNAGITPA